MPTDEAMAPAANRQIVVARIRLGVIHPKAFAPSQARMPLAAATPVTAAIEH